MHRQYWLEKLGQTTSTEVWWNLLSNPNWNFWTYFIRVPTKLFSKKTLVLKYRCSISYRPMEKPQLSRDQMGMRGSGKENWALLPVLSKQLLQCILLLWDIYLLPRSKVLSLKYCLGIYWSVDIYNVVSPRQDDPRSIIILGTTYKCQRHYLGNWPWLYEI